MTQMQREHLTVRREKAVLVSCLLPTGGPRGPSALATTDPHDPLSELRSLADTAGALVVDELLQKKQKPDPATFIGKGKVGELAQMVDLHGADVAIFDNDLSPSQIGNIEQRIEAKVIDRSELILDIFAARARTHEARLQVELAQLEYTYPRLRAMWSHLERIVGGAPTGIGTRGPGEQQLETDRRIVQRKKAQLRREIVQIQSRKTREVQARNRDYFTVGLVGYTNAGKSTLFNTLTKASGGGGAYADDKLFATLSTRTRRWNLGGGDTVMVSDTVGFVRNLPHHLVASFRATLEEAIHADLLLLVLDVADPRARHQLDTVRTVLNDIGAGATPHVLTLNKIDCLDNNADLLVFLREFPDALQISARTGLGMLPLIEFVRTASRGQTQQLTITVDVADGKAIHFLENRSAVIDRVYEDNRVTFTVRIGDRQLDRFLAMGTTAQLPDDSTNAQGWHA